MFVKYVFANFQANIVCKQLGFLGALNATIGSAFGLVTPVFSYDDVKCIGFESTIDDCPHIDEDDCGPDEGDWGAS